MTPTLKVIVAGAGVLGLTSALALARAGARVVLTDPAPTGRNASGVAAGMLAPVMEAALDSTARPHFDLLLAARDLWPALAAETGVELDRTGALAVGDAAGLAGLADEMERLGAPGRRLGGADLAALAPGLAAQDALFTGEDWRLGPAQALAALTRAAEAAGVELRRAPLSEAEAADWRLLAVGADPHALAPELSRLAPIRGHILRAPELAYQGAVARGDGVYATPGARGLVVGATMEAGARGLTVDPEQIERLRRAGAGLFPALAQAQVVGAVGVRAATADGLPMVGFSRTPGVLIASGARRNGWLLAPLTAKIVAALVFGDDPGPFAPRMAPARFEPGGGAF